MRPAEKIEKMITKLELKASARLDEEVHDAISAALDKSKQTTSATVKPGVWRIIMNNRISKLAAAAVIMVVAALAITFMGRFTAPAYGLEQSIEANHSVRYIYIKDFRAGEDEPRQFWSELDESGQVKNVRMDFPEWAGSGDGPKIIVWKDNKAQVWLKKKKILITITDKAVADHMLKWVEECDPKLAVEHLYERQARGEVKIQIVQPSNKSEVISVTATYLPESSKPNVRWVMSVDQGTKLVTAIQVYQLKGGEWQYTSVMEFYDYNKPIDASMFALNEEVPDDAMRIDQTTQEIGLPKGELTDEQIAAEVARQFFKALIAKDYTMAGKLFEGIPAEKLQEGLGHVKFLRIISIGPAAPHPIAAIAAMGGLIVPCTVEIEKDGKLVQWKLDRIGVRPVHSQPNRWTIFGGI